MVNTDRLIEILEDAETRPVGVDRDRYIADACAGDAELKDQVTSLLKSHESAGAFLMNTVVPPSFFVSEEPGDLIGRYKLLEKLGEGGCGVVYAAEQTEPVRRRVALKVIKLGMDTRQVIARFEAERQALALMDHPNIAKVLDAGATQSGRPFFVMELVRGVAITVFCDQNNLSTSERLELFISVCSAIQHAHQKGVIHRDIKPSNILVTLHDSVPVPRVIDFGIAKAIEGKLTNTTVYTQLLQFVGTPAYMSPEQAEMSGLDVDTRSDIYSLGVLLYELLTGTPPFDGQKLLASGIDEMRKTIRETEPASPSTRLTANNARLAVGHPSLRNGRAKIPSDLDWIVMKCLEKDRSRRYETANGLATDLQRHLKNEPVAARPPSTAYKLHKAWRRNKIAWTAVAAVSIALVIGIGLAMWQASVATHAQKAAEQEKTAAQHQAYIANMLSAGPHWEENNYQRVRQLLADTRAFSGRGFEWYYWQRQTHLNLMTMYGHTDMVKSIAFFPDGERIVTGSRDNSTRVWDITSGKAILTLLGHKSSVNSVAVSRDGKQIATASSDHDVIIWDSSDGRELLRLKGHSNSINAVAFSPDGQTIVTGDSDGTGRIWEIATQRVIITLKGHTNSITSVAFSPGGTTVATGSKDGTAQVWRLADGTRRFRPLGHAREVMTVAFSPDGRRIITGSVDQSAQFWDAETGAPLPLPLIGREPIVTLAFSQDGRRIVTGSKNSTARVWNATNSQPEQHIKGHVRGLQAVAISPDGTRVVTGGFDRNVKVWDVEGAREYLQLEENSTNSVLAVAISPDGKRVATGSGTFNEDSRATGTGEQSLQVWDPNTKKRLLTFPGHSSGVSSVAFSPDGSQILSGSGDHTAKLWDATTGEHLSTLKGHAKAVTSVAFFPSGDRIITGSQDQTARVWNRLTGLELFILTGHTGAISSVAVSSDGLWLATGGFDEKVRVWDAANGRLVRTIETPESRVYSVAFSPDSRRVAVAGWDPPTVWDLANTNAEPVTLHGHGVVSSIAFFRDGLRMVTGGLNGISKVWEAATGRELLTLRGHTRYVYAVAISADGRRIITGSADRTARIWEAATTNQVATWQAEERAAVNFRRSR